MRTCFINILAGICAGMSVQLCYAQADTSHSYHIHCYCNTDRSPAGTMINFGHPKGGWMLTYRLMQMQGEGNFSGTSPVSDQQVYTQYLMAPESMKMDMHMLMAMYGFSDRLSVMAMFNYNHAQMTMNMPEGVIHMHGMNMTAPNSHMNTQVSGLGDTRLYLLYQVPKGNYNLLLSGGLSLPTGSIQHKGNAENMYEGQRLPYAMQAGSGTVDVLPGVTVSRHAGKYSFLAQASGVLRFYNNAAGYHLGNEATFNAWAARQLAGVVSASLRAEAGWSQSVQGRDGSLYAGLEPAANPVNYGGTKINTYAGINVYLPASFFRNTRLAVEAGLPLYQHFNGIQTSTRYLLNLGLQTSFH